MTKGVLIDTKEGKRVVKGLGYYETPEIENLKQLVKISTEKHGDAIAFRFKGVSSRRASITSWCASSWAVTSGLKSLGGLPCFATLSSNCRA